MKTETYSIKISLEKDCFEDLSTKIERIEKILDDIEEELRVTGRFF